MQFGPHQDAGLITDRLLELVRLASVDEIMFFYYAEDQNDGHETLERIKEWVDRSRPYRKALAEAGVAVSLNPWHTLLHADRGRKLKPGQNWQTLVDPNGFAASAQVCPLDPGWREYYEAQLKLYGNEGYRVIWIDDDIRLHNHAPLEWGGCFCPLHIAEFNRRAKVRATREEIVANCTAPGAPHPWRDIWMDMNEDVYLRMISRWREIVEAGGSRLGIMTSLPEAHGAEGRRWGDWWKAFGGGNPPIVRPHFWAYGEVLGSNLANSIALLDQGRWLQPPGTESGPECDNGPYGPWNKSFRQTFASLALAHVLGSTNLNISLYDFMGNDPHDEPERPEHLREWRPALDWLADEFPMTLAPVGVGVPWNEDMGRRIRTDGSGRWASLECPTRGWAKWLGACGHAFTMRPSPAVNAIGGPIAWSFSDDELRGWLSRGLLLDGAAADILIERGFGKYIGFKSGRFVTLDDALYSIEECIDGEFSLRPGAQMPLNAQSYAAALFQGQLLPGARVVSDLRTPTQSTIGHGLVVFENELGGRVAVVPWLANGAPPAKATHSGVPLAPAEVLMNTQRAAQLAKTVEWLSAGKPTGRAEGGAHLIPQFLTDGKTWRGVVWNASADEVTRFRVLLPDGMPPVKSATRIDARGNRLAARITGKTSISVELPHPLYQWEFVVLE
jgi:hypothetical protein